jgi:hypothetical protein
MILIAKNGEIWAILTQRAAFYAFRRKARNITEVSDHNIDPCGQFFKTSVGANFEPTRQLCA